MGSGPPLLLQRCFLFLPSNFPTSLLGRGNKRANSNLLEAEERMGGEHGKKVGGRRGVGLKW